MLETGCQWSLLPRDFASLRSPCGQLPALSCGCDAGKKIKGRKRQVLTDTNGLLLGAVVTPASVQDRDGPRLLLCLFCHRFLSLLMIFADGGYAGKLEQFVQRMGQIFGHGAGFGLGIIKKLEDQKDFSETAFFHSREKPMARCLISFQESDITAVFVAVWRNGGQGRKQAPHCRRGVRTWMPHRGCAARLHGSVLVRTPELGAVRGAEQGEF